MPPESVLLYNTSSSTDGETGEWVRYPTAYSALCHLMSDVVRQGPACPVRQLTVSGSLFVPKEVRTNYALGTYGDLRGNHKEGQEKMLKIAPLIAHH